jgi:hypothetical protein
MKTPSPIPPNYRRIRVGMPVYAFPRSDLIGYVADIDEAHFELTDPELGYYALPLEIVRGVTSDRVVVNLRFEELDHHRLEAEPSNPRIRQIG